MSDSNRTPKFSTGDFRIPAQSPWSQAWKMAAVVGVLGFAVGGYGYSVDPRRFAFSYLLGFVTVMTMALGGVFFVLIQHLTGAGWSVTVRRTSEFFCAGMVIVPLLALPNLLSLKQLYPWWSKSEESVAHAQQHAPNERVQIGAPRQLQHAEAAAAAEAGAENGPLEAAEEHAMSQKTWYLTHSFFAVRFVLVLLAFLWLGGTLFRYSTEQDKTGDPKWTVKLQRMAPPGIIVFAFSLTVGAVDWVMGLEPGWYSTMFGVRVFGASALIGFALNILVSLGLKHAGVVRDEFNVEHFHDLGKLMFAFLIFWGYVSFSEFMLIWYAAIPEETIYYHHRWDFAWWRNVSVAIVVVKFIVPFYLTLSRNAKRNLGFLGFSAAWIAVLHLVELYYWVMPYYQPGELPFSVPGLMTDVGCVLGCVGVYLAVVFYRMLNHPVIPVRDPRLQRALEFVNA